MSPTMSDPCEMANLLVGYVDDELSDTQSRLVEGHVARCGRCAEALQRAAVDRMARFELAEAFEDEADADVHAVATGGGRRPWARVLAPGLFAATASLLMVLATPDRFGRDEGPSGPEAMTLASLERQACEGTAWSSAPDDDAPVCDEAMASLTLALASFPEDQGLDALDEPGVCQPDDGGDLACMPEDEPYSG